MIGYKKSSLERQSLSEVKMGRGSPICERLRLLIVEKFQNNIPQCKIAKTLKISSSTVHNIIKRFRESGEIFVRKGQGRKPILDARDLQALRRHCIKNRFCNRNHCMGSGSRRLLWAKAHLKWTEAKWKTVVWSDKSKFEIVFGNHGRHVLRTKDERDHPACYQRSVQKPASLMVWGCISAYWMGSLHIWKGTINAERYIEVLEQHMLPSRRRLLQGRPCIFQQDNAKPHTASITTAWLRRRRVRVLNWPACSPDLSPIENIWRIMKWKIRQRRPRTVEQLESYIRQEWDNIPLPKLQQLVSSVPRRLRTVVKRRGDAT